MIQQKKLIQDINTCPVAYGECAFWWLGQLGFVVKLGTVVCYIDPYLSNSPARLIPALLRPADVTNATMVLGTHDHSDHIDRPVWPAIADASPRCVFIVPELVLQSVMSATGIAADRIRGLDNGKSVQIGDVRITGVPAAHELLDQDRATGGFPCLGYVLEGNGVTVYHSGDTCVYEGMQQLLRQWKFDLAFLPINGRDAQRFANDCIGNMTYQEAVDLAGSIHPGMTVPAHFDMFAHNGENPQLFIDYLRVKYHGLRTMLPVHGERVVITRNCSHPLNPPEGDF